MQLIKFKNKVLIKTKFFPIVLVFGFFFFISLGVYSQDTRDTGFKYFKNYSYKEYDHQPQNWGMVQAQNGMIYVANQGGVLEYDGVSWRIIGIPGFATVRSLAIDETGTIYIGGTGEIGYLAPDQKGSLQYVSLLDQLDENQRKFTNVWRVFAAKDGIYFSSYEALLRWDPKQKQMKVWPPSPSHRFLNSFIVKGRLFIYHEKDGLMQMVNDELVMFSQDDVFKIADERVFIMLPFDQRKPYDTEPDGNALLIGTRLNGFYLFDGLTLKPFPTEVDEYLKKNVAVHGIRLTSGDFALATRLGGLIIMSPQGRLKYIFDKTSGLQDDNVKYIMEDKQGNLWLCLDNGISKIEYASPFFIYDGRSGLPGLVLSVVRQEGDLYSGTFQRLYVRESQSKTFRPIAGIYNSCWSLLAVEDSVLAATSDGVFQVDNKSKVGRMIMGDPTYVLLRSVSYPLRTWCGTNRGLAELLLKNGQWTEERRVENIDLEIRSIAEDQKGNVWLGTLAGVVFKVTGPVDGISPVVTRFDKSHGLPENEVYAARVAGTILFATGKGIFRFDEIAGKFIPDKTLGEEFAGGSKPVSRMVEDKNNTIWFHSESRNYRAISGPGGTFTIDATPFRRIPTVQVNTIYPDPDGKSIWFANFDGLIRYDTTLKKNYRQVFQTLVRKVFTNDKLIYDGCNNKTGLAVNDHFPIIEYKDRNLRFEFVAPFFEAETETRYRCFLEGYDHEWSTWNKESKKNYTNLDPGWYTFRVQAMNVYEYEGSEDTFRFKILSPWYWTWWSFLLFGIVFLLLMFLVVKWRSGTLENEKQKLEQIVNERTKEINEKNLKLKEQSEKLAEIDHMKSLFFANISHEFRTPLTLIMSPLEQMLSESRGKKQKQKLEMMLTNSQRLLTLIKQLLDLSRFDSGKMKLEAACQNIVPFLEGILTSFQILTQQNNLDLEFQSKEKDISLYFDTQKMEEVMFNLLINAVKFTPGGGKILVTVSKEDEDPLGFVKISVQDTGIGFPKEHSDYIFDRFYQAANLDETSYSGSGIGLALTKEIVLLHYGKIDVQSREGEGTEFIIRLPLGNKHLKPNEIVIPSKIPTVQKKSLEVEKLFMPVEEEDETGAVENIEPSMPQNIILVVDDNPIFRKYIRGRLEPLHKVVEAVNGQDGINKAKETIPDLIISDIMMPGTNGYELCNMLKKDLATSHIPIILLTARAADEDIIEGLETGADDYITKPFNTKILIARIKNLMDRRRQLHLKRRGLVGARPDERPVSTIDDVFLKETMDIIERNLANPEFNEDQLRQEMHVSQDLLLKKLQGLTGETPTQFILSCRLERAAHLLKNNSGGVAEVAFRVGFPSTAEFARCFKEKFQQLPTAFQTSHQASVETTGK